MNKISKIAGATMMLAVAMSSCSVPKKVAYFQDVETNTIIESVKQTPITIRPEDKISIVVKSRDAMVSDLFNLPAYSSRIGNNGTTSGSSSELRSYTGSQSEGIASYTVSPEGTIDFPILGTLNLAGMTRSEAAAYIKGELTGRDLVKDPVVVIEFLNSGVSVMGEVLSPGRYDINKDHLTVLEALSLAGDLTITGQRENVRVLREADGKVNAYVMDITNTAELVKSPGYYLQQGDVVYVEPNTQRKRSTTINGNNALSVSFWVSVGSLLTSVVTTIAVFVTK